MTSVPHGSERAGRNEKTRGGTPSSQHKLPHYSSRKHVRARHERAQNKIHTFITRACVFFFSFSYLRRRHGVVLALAVVHLLPSLAQERLLLLHGLYTQKVYSKGNVCIALRAIKSNARAGATLASERAARKALSFSCRLSDVRRVGAGRSHQP